MKADLNALKKELNRLTHFGYLKKELGRVAAEITNFDKLVTITPQARTRLNQLEKRFHAIIKAIGDLQDRVDSGFSKFKKMVERGRLTVRAAAQGKTRMKTAKRARPAGKKKSATARPKKRSR